MVEIASSQLGFMASSPQTLRLSHSFKSEEVKNSLIDDLVEEQLETKTISIKVSENVSL